MKKITIGILTLALLAGCTGKTQKNMDTEKKYPPFDIQNMDLSVKPGNDFFVYANGNWLKNNPIPADKNSRSSFDELVEKNRHDIREIIEEAAAAKDAQPGSITDKIGKFYNSGMDTIALEQQGLSPLKVFFGKIDSIRSIADVQTVAAWFQTYGMNPFFAIFSNQDAKNSSSVIAGCWQAGIGLPERDYYFNNDESTRKIREAYIVHLTKMFELLKDEPAVAEKNAQTIMKIETRLAKASFTNVENEDPQKTYNKVTIDGLKKLAPNMDWKSYFTLIGYPGISEINVSQPVFHQGAEQHDEERSG